jgi:multidrug resistance protein MdtO
VAGGSVVARLFGPLETLFVEELAPRPGRLAGSLRTAACCCLVTAVAMVFQIPAAYDAAFVVFLISGEDVVASVVTALASTVAVTVAVALALFLSTFDAGSIAVRLPVMAAATLVGMFASRALKIGPAAFLAGFVLIEAQTMVDQVSSTEEMVHSVLWLWVVIELPVAVVVLAQVATGETPGARARRSGVTLLRALADSLRHPGSEDLRTQNAEAGALVASVRRAAMVDAAAKQRLGGNMRSIETFETLLAMRDVLPAETPVAARERLADDCAACADALEHGTPIPARAQPITGDPALAAAPAGVLPVVLAMTAALERLRDSLDRRNRGLVEPADPAARPPRLTDPAERRENFRFAVKSTIAVISAYLIYTGYGYFGISTALTTCFFVSLGSLGESVQKLTLRLTGAMVGGVIAGLCIVFLRPSMTDVGQLALLVGVVTGASAWIAASSVRLSYFGMQIALAFLLGLLQGYAPPSHLKVLINRVVGILLGNVLVTIVFSTLWPTSARERAGASIDQALRGLAGFLGAGTHPAGARLAILQAIDKARGFQAFSGFELRMLPEAQRAEARHGTSVEELQRIAGLAFVVAESPGSPGVADSLRGANERSAQLLLARAGGTAPGPAIGPRAVGPVADGEALSDRAAIEASALLSSELEKGHGVAS